MLTTNNLFLAAVATAVFYYLNNRNVWVFLTNFQYILVFIAIYLGISLLERFQIWSAKKTITNVATKLNLIDNPIVAEAQGDVNGQLLHSCYNVPYKVVRTQYGDRSLLAGYNEHVVAAQQGGVDNAPPYQGIYVDCMGGDQDAIDVKEA